MSVRLRLQRHGRRKKPFYYIVAMDSRGSRDSKYIERLGSYDPNVSPAKIDLNTDRAFTWLDYGAEPTNTVRAILSYKGVMYKKHLQRGVKKGALTQEEADKKLAEWLEQKSEKISSKMEKIQAETQKAEQERLEAEKKVNEARIEELKKKTEEMAKEAVKQDSEEQDEESGEDTSDESSQEESGDDASEDKK